MGASRPDTDADLTTALQGLQEQNAELSRKLEEAEDTLTALRSGDVDAVVVGSNVFVLDGVDAESNRFRGNVLAQITDAIIALDNEHRVTYFNTAAEREYDITASAVLGRTIDSVLGPQEWLRVDSPAQAALRADGFWRGEFERVRSSGTTIFEELSVSRLLDPSGRIGGLLVIVRDVTERTRAETERETALESATAARDAAEAARAEAEGANRAKSEFLAVMSHELRTPLNSIAGYSELLALGIRGPVTSDQLSDLERIQRSQRHLLGLIEGVLNFAKLDAGAVQYAVEDVSVDDVISTCEALIASQLARKRLRFEWRKCEQRLVARSDSEKTRQIVLNLLSNALKFTAPGGTISVECAPIADQRIVIRVADTGVGISADQLDRIFEPFVQIDSSLTREHEGTGLGLAISRDLARGMGGDLEAQSTVGGGSTFTLTLPAA